MAAYVIAITKASGTDMPTVHLADRSLLRVRGADAVTFLQGLVTTDVAALGRGEARPGALLSPQGKILFHFVVLADGDTLALDCAKGDAPALLKRLTLYKLRSSVDLSVEDQDVIGVSWENDPVPSPVDSATSQIESTGFLDRSYPFAVTRTYGAGIPAATAGAEALDRLRIIHAVAEPGRDFANGDAFPHDVNLDQTGGVSFRKGCYVGQEVVSRMQHRGTARRRAVVATGHTDLTAGVEVLCGGRAAGAIGTVAGRLGLAIVRLDRVKDAMDQGVPITAGGIEVSLALPPGATFGWPDAATAGDE